MTSVRPGMKDEDIALELGWVLFFGAWVNFVRPGVRVVFWVDFVRPRMEDEDIALELG